MNKVASECFARPLQEQFPPAYFFQYFFPKTFIIHSLPQVAKQVCYVKDFTKTQMLTNQANILRSFYVSPSRKIKSALSLFKALEASR